eukprot:g73219.t1
MEFYFQMKALVTPHPTNLLAWVTQDLQLRVISLTARLLVMARRRTCTNCRPTRRQDLQAMALLTTVVISESAGR